jgi:hypothetical protein
VDRWIGGGAVGERGLPAAQESRAGSMSVCSRADSGGGGGGGAEARDAMVLALGGGWWRRLCFDVHESSGRGVWRSRVVVVGLWQLGLVGKREAHASPNAGEWLRTIVHNCCILRLFLLSASGPPCSLLWALASFQRINVFRSALHPPPTPTIAAAQTQTQAIRPEHGGSVILPPPPEPHFISATLGRKTDDFASQLSLVISNMAPPGNTLLGFAKALPKIEVRLGHASAFWLAPSISQSSTLLQL